MGLLTITLKLHKPSKNKQKILDDAILNYNMALNFLLDNAARNLDEIREYCKERAQKHNFKDEYNVMALSKWICTDMSRELNKYHVQPFKDALKHNFATIIANHLRTKSTEVIGLKDRGLRANGPVFFCRYDTKRSYSILYDSKKDRYFAKLYLMNNSHARSSAARLDDSERLKYIHKEMRILERSKRRETFIIVPLSFGKYQERFLEEALKNPEILRTAKLFSKNDEYYLSISIECGKAKNTNSSYNIENYIGVSRGIKTCLNYTIVDRNGDVLEVNKILTSELHKAANEIVAKAAFYKSQVIVQNLQVKGDKLNWSGNQQLILSKYEYSKLIKLLEYKLEAVNLPKPIKVSSVGIFYTCSNCGYNSMGNRSNKDTFICTQCGEIHTIDEIGSLNIARKLIDYAASKIKIHVDKKPDGIIFKNEMFGFECFVRPEESKENQLKILKAEIIATMNNIENAIRSFNKVDNKKISILMKLKSVENFMDIIEFV